MLIARTDELATIEAALAEQQVVTLTGPGGVGKTALARAIGRSNESSYFVDLTAFDGGTASLTEGVAGALGFRSFSHFVGDASGLLVLDNCEHVIDAAASLILATTAAVPDIRVLATSREALGLPGELTIPIDPLGTEGSPSPAERLFRYEASRRGYGAKVENATMVERLVWQLDGLPLALELAAARLAAMTPGEMLDEFAVRLDLLSRTRPRGPDRHQSLAAAIAWSFGALDPQLQQLLSELSLLPQPFTRDAAVAIASLDADTVARGLGTLAERSLLRHEAGTAGSRFRMLETIRVFAREHGRDLEESAVARLVEHACDVAATIRVLAETADPATTQTLASNYSLIRAALAHSLNRDPGPHTSVALVEALWWLEDVGYQAEAAELVERVVGRWVGSGDLGPTHGILSALHRSAGSAENARRAARTAVDYEDVRGCAYGHRTLGQIARSDGRWSDAADHFTDGIAAARQVGSDAVAIEMELHLAVTEVRSGDVASGLDRMWSVYRRTEEFGLLGPIALAFIAWNEIGRDPIEARRAAEQALEASTEMAYDWGIGSACLTLGMTSLRAGNLAAAARETAQALDSFHDIGDKTAIAIALLAASAVLGQSGDGEGAHAAAAARADHVAGALSGFEVELFESLGAVAPDPAVAALSPPELSNRLRRAAEVETKADLPNEVRLGGDVCVFVFHGHESQHVAIKGMADLVRLLVQPGREVAALDLMGAAVVSGSAGPVLDATSRRNYQKRITELEEDIESAVAFGDEESATRFRVELEFLVAELTSSFGLGGRSRTVGEPAERARSAVTHRIRDAVEKISRADERLASHLRTSIKTGRFCSYQPQPTERWEVSGLSAREPAS
ncbi:MAG: hypothetical protein HKN24_01535 [Acidimicrobiales bacterium]|nr:hypothetical protein [Acidimicrobiales bacterium]NNF08832.1 hypothetical protein [Acidimicrobiia bacterium]